MNYSPNRDAAAGNAKKCFSLPPVNPHLHSSKKIMKGAWGEFVCEVSADDLHIRADLTLQKGMMVDVAASGATPAARYYKKIDEEIAGKTIASFLHRMNHAAYKNAYKRYGKKLRVLSAIEGGDAVLRQHIKIGDSNKHLHAHILLEQPSHMSFPDMYAAITKNWYALKWSNVVLQIEPIQTLHGSVAYNAESSTDSLDLGNTHL